MNAIIADNPSANSTNPLTRAQIDGWACIHCGRTPTVSQPVGHVDGRPVFACADEEAAFCRPAPSCPKWCRVDHAADTTTEPGEIHHRGHPITVTTDGAEYLIYPSLLVDLNAGTFEAGTFMGASLLPAHDLLVLVAVLRLALGDVCDAESDALEAGLTQFPGWEPKDPAVMARAEAVRASLDSEDMTGGEPR